MALFQGCARQLPLILFIMKQRPSFQFYQQDFLGSLDVKTMTPEEVGCYCLLMFNCYNNGGKIPNDLGALTVLCHGTKPAQKVLKKFYISGEFFKHKRIDLEIKKQNKFSKKMSSAGRKGNEVRWGNRENTLSPSDRLSDHQAIASDRSSSSTSSSTSIKEKTTKKETDLLYERFQEICVIRKLQVKIGCARYMEMREEYLSKLNWWPEVQKCTDWCYDNGKLIITTTRLRNWMSNAVKFSKAEEVKKLQSTRDLKPQKQKTVIKPTREPLWQSPK